MYNEGHRRARMLGRGKVAGGIRATVARTDVANVVAALLLCIRVNRVGIVYEATVGGVDRFTVTPYVFDPTTV